jgi:aldehyde:ferredoxin oxidoreductase
MRGYTGKILNVNLTEGRCVEERLPDNFYYKYLSGIGLATRLLFERIPENADPLGPDNILAFVSGLLTGTGSLFTGRWMAAAKSPLTHTWGDANCGGNFSPAIKQCGYDGIFVSGISPHPVYLRIGAKEPQILTADDLWGKDTTITEEILISRASGKKRPAVACIGPAGEKLSLISGICNDRGRIAARSGLGAVMGSKRLKAIVLEGARPVRPADSAAMKRLSKLCSHRSRGLPLPGGKSLVLLGKLMAKMPLLPAMDGVLIASMFGKWGTISMNQFSAELGDAPIMNWKGSCKDYPVELSNSIDPDRILARRKMNYHCFSCPLGCGGICSLNIKDKEEWPETHKPEYETVMSFGGLLLNSDMESIYYINELLNRAGMDTISAGGTAAFALECFEKGILTLEDTGGIDLGWGNAQSIIALLEKMIKREGIGNLLADGVKIAAERIGKGSDAFAVSAGGQEPAMHDPRNDPGFGLHASVDPTPGRHTIGAQQYYELYGLWKKVKYLPKPGLLIPVKSKFKADREKAVCAKANSCFSQLYNGAGLCLFGALLGAHRVPVFEWLNAATGWDRSPDEYMEVGRRIQTLKQLFNIKHGIEPISLKIHPRTVGVPALTEGPNRGRSFDLEKMMKDYWEEIGWDRETGNPMVGTISELGLSAVLKGSNEDLPSAVENKSTSARNLPPKGSKPVITQKSCIACTTCVQECPVSCLDLKQDAEGSPSPFPVLSEPDRCIGCGFCAECCPVEAIAMINP